MQIDIQRVNRILYVTQSMLQFMRYFPVHGVDFGYEI